MLKRFLKILTSRSLLFALLALLQIGAFFFLVWQFSNIGPYTYAIMIILSVLVLVFVFEKDAKQIFFRVELPLAMPAIFSGIRMSLIYTVSWAILAAMIGQGGLGEFIYRGIDANVKEYIVIGSIPIAILAVVFRLLIDKLEKIIVSKGIQGD